MKSPFFKQVIFVFVLVTTATITRAQSNDDCATSDNLLRAFYSCLDVPKGKQIDSARFTNLFWPGAQLEGAVQSKRDTSKMTNFGITPQEYLRGMKGFTGTHRFKEWETGRQVLSFGHMTCIYSAYELIDVDPKGDTTTLRGVNVFHLFFDNNRWWITYCTYEEEGPGVPIPPESATPPKKD